MEENEEEEEPIDIEFTEQKDSPEMIRCTIEDEKNIVMTNFIENHKSKLMRRIFQKVTG